MTATCTAFAGPRRIASGDLAEVALKTKALLDEGTRVSVLIFDDATGDLVEVDFRGTPDDVARRIGEARGPIPPEATVPTDPEGSRGPGRPKLGVVAREVTLLPRHWDWLNGQPGGASVALRKLVEEARRANEGRDRERRVREAAYRFMTALAGDLPGFEEATRALFSGDWGRFAEQVEPWPSDIRDHAKTMTAGAFPA